MHRANAHTLEIRRELQERIRKAPAGGVFHTARMEVLNRNSFCIQLSPDAPVFTVKIEVGGSLTDLAEQLS